MAKSRKQHNLKYQPAFEEAWRVYPLRKGKLKASEAYEKVPPWIRNETILEAIKRYAASPTVQKYIKAGTPEFILHFATWLNQARWEDEPEPGTRIVPPIGDTMSREFAQDVTACILSGYNVQRGGERFVEIVTSKPKGRIEMVAIVPGGGVVVIAFSWDWPKEIQLWFANTKRNGMTPDELHRMGERNAQLDVMLRKAKG